MFQVTITKKKKKLQNISKKNRKNSRENSVASFPISGPCSSSVPGHSECLTWAGFHVSSQVFLVWVRLVIVSLRILFFWPSYNWDGQINTNLLLRNSLYSDVKSKCVWFLSVSDKVVYFFVLFWFFNQYPIWFLVYLRSLFSVPQTQIISLFYADYWKENTLKDICLRLCSSLI